MKGLLRSLPDHAVPDHAVPDHADPERADPDHADRERADYDHALRERADHEHADHEHADRGHGLAGIPARGGGTTFCRHCSVAAPERLFRVVGAWSVIDGVPVWDCAGCTRALLHEIEHGTEAGGGAALRHSPR